MQDQITLDYKELAIAEFFSELAYAVPTQRAQILSDSPYGNDFQLDERFQNENFSVIVEKRGNKAYHAYRGTSNSDDVLTDVSLAFGQLNTTDRFRSNQRVSDIARSYDKRHSEVIHVGHSLGGTIADQMGRQRGDKSISFNQGSTPLHDYGSGNSKQKQVRIENDFVSHFTTGDRITLGNNHKAGLLDRHVNKYKDSHGWLTNYKPASIATSVVSSFMSHFTSNFSSLRNHSP